MWVQFLKKKICPAQKALELFQQMHQEGVQPDPVNYLGVLNVCASVVALKDRRCIHEQYIKGAVC
jgi:hypothetical protein